MRRVSAARRRWGNCPTAGCAARSPAPGQHARHAGQHAAPVSARDARARHGRRGHAEERHEERVARAVVLVRQVVERPCPRGSRERGRMPSWRDTRLVAEPGAPAQQARSNSGSFWLAYIDTRQLARQARDAGIQADEMRREQDGRAGAFAGAPALDAHQPLDARRGAHHSTPARRSAAEGAEMRARQLLAFGGRLPRKALLQVDARHLAPLGDQPEREGADAAPTRENAQRQEVREPHQDEDEPAHAGSALRPRASCSGCSPTGTARGIRGSGSPARGSCARAGFSLARIRRGSGRR